MIYTVLEIWRVTDVIVIFHFGLFLAYLPPLKARKIKNFKNMKKKAPEDTIILRMPTKNYD